MRTFAGGGEWFALPVPVEDEAPLSMRREPALPAVIQRSAIEQDGRDPRLQQVVESGGRRNSMLAQKHGELHASRRERLSLFFKTRPCLGRKRCWSWHWVFPALHEFLLADREPGELH